jgi:hypothetical protein
MPNAICLIILIATFALLVWSGIRAGRINFERNPHTCTPAIPENTTAFQL